MCLVSIVVPIYNVQPYLERCIDSILNQTYSNIEVILVDDGSTDKCPIICDDYASKDQRVRVIHKTNGGLSDARNEGIKSAKGDVVSFIDSDDWISSSFVEIMLRVMNDYNSDIVECDITKTHEYIEEDEIVFENKIHNYTKKEALNLLVSDNVFHQYVWNKLYKRAVIANVEFPYGKYNEDEYWTYKVFGRAGKVTKVENSLYFYYQRSGSIMGQAYSLKRLDGIEAKIERQAYIESFYPEIAESAKRNLLTTIMYAGQMSLKYLNSEDKRKAFNYLYIQYKAIVFDKKLRDSVSLKQNLWFLFARLNFKWACAVRNLLKIGF